MDINDVIEKLHQLADSQKIIYKEKKYGITAVNSLGIYHKDLKELAKDIPGDDLLAVRLFDTGIYEARLLCSKIFHPKNLTEELMEKWVVTFENWEVCDSFCMGLFAKSFFAVAKIQEWSEREEEFQKRAAFATLAAYCMADKTADNSVFEQFFPLIISQSNDERVYVKKAVNWALRNMGKRNKDLKKRAIDVAYQILKIESKSAQWIAKDAIKELEKPDVRLSDYPRRLYRSVG